MKKIVKSLILIFVATSVALSQSSNGTVSGTVEDWFGAVFPSTEVKLVGLTKEKEELVGQTKTNQNGEYSFSNLPLGLYEIQVKIFSDRIIRKRIELTSSRSVQKNIDISNKPCSDESDNTKAIPITDADRAEIVNELINLKFPQPVTEKIVFIPRNIDIAWLGADQKAKLNIVTRDKVQTLANKNNHQNYYWIYPLKQIGGCVDVSMNEDVAIKGQLEDANMAGGGMIYEFRKIAGRWIGQAVGGWIS